MTVYPENMEKNLNLLGGLYNSQKLLLKLTKKGLSRQEAYSLVKKMQWKLGIIKKIS